MPAAKERRAKREQSPCFPRNDRVAMAALLRDFCKEEFDDVDLEDYCQITICVETPHGDMSTLSIDSHTGEVVRPLCDRGRYAE